MLAAFVNMLFSIFQTSAFIDFLKQLFGVTLCLALFAGCNMLDSHIREMDAMRAVQTSLADRLQSGALSQVQASGQVLEPGVTVEAGTKYFASAYYKGLSGQLSVAASGTLGDSAKDEYYKIVNDKSLTDAERSKRLFDLITKVMAPATSQPQ